MDFLRSKEYIEYFDYLDKAGGFFYERWGDAPVHSLAVGALLNQSQVHFFENIGYYHNPFSNCPVEPHYSNLNCDCSVKDSLTFQPYSCIPRWLDYKSTPWFQ